MACPKCDGVVLTIHCKAKGCTWQRCVKCRAYGSGDRWSEYEVPRTLESIYALQGIPDQDRNTNRDK